MRASDENKQAASQKSSTGVQVTAEFQSPTEIYALNTMSTYLVRKKYICNQLRTFAQKQKGYPISFKK